MVSSKRAFDSWDLLKVAALLFMFADHAGVFLFTSNEACYWLRAFGRGAAPIFLFLAGYAKNYRFSWEIFLLAMLYTVFEWVYFWHINTLNILFTILLCRMVFQWFEVRGRVIKRPVEWALCAMALFTTAVLTQYGSLGFMMALAGYMRRHKEHYSKAMLYGLTTTMTLVYAAYNTYFAEPPVDPFLSVGVISGVMFWCMTFEIRELPGAWGALGLRRLLKLLSYYSAYIYVLHLVALMALTGISQ